MAYFNKYATSGGDKIKGTGVQRYKADTCQAWLNDGHSKTDMCQTDESFDQSSLDDFNVQAFVNLTPMLQEIANLPSDETMKMAGHNQMGDPMSFKGLLEGMSSDEKI